MVFLPCVALEYIEETGKLHSQHAFLIDGFAHDADLLIWKYHDAVSPLIFVSRVCIFLWLFAFRDALFLRLLKSGIFLLEMVCMDGILAIGGLYRYPQHLV